MASSAKNNPNQMRHGKTAVASSALKLRKGTPRIVLPAKEVNDRAVRSLINDCLVPLLAQEFLRRRGSAEQSKTDPMSSDPTFAPLGKEDGC